MARVPTVLVDTNVILDVALRRAPWAVDAARLLDAVARGAARGFAAGHAVTTVHYIVEENAGRAQANAAVSDLLRVLSVVPLDGPDFQRALSLEMRDYEDAVQVAACLKIGADYLVTRDRKDFRGASVRAHAPGEVLGILSGSRRPRR
jgi:predicted nucleic acid-binding protein